MKPKTKKVNLQVDVTTMFSYHEDSLKQDWNAFYNESMGRLLVAIGEGNFKNAVYNILDQSHARGAYNYHKRLLEQNEN
jgi:hypothetical protein